MTDWKQGSRSGTYSRVVDRQARLAWLVAVPALGFAVWAATGGQVWSAVVYAGVALVAALSANRRRLRLFHLTPERQVTLVAPAFVLGCVPSTVALALHARGSAMSDGRLAKHVITVVMFLVMAALSLWGKRRLREMGLFDEEDRSEGRDVNSG